MLWNPYLNGISAAAYIWAVVLLLQVVTAFNSNKPDTILDPIGALSLLVFSVALMGFIFFYRPVVLILENKKDEAVSYFLRTLGAFGITVIVVVAAIGFIVKP